MKKLLTSLQISNVPECTLNSLCTLHTGGSAVVRAADGAGPPPCRLSSPSRDTAQGLGCSVAGSGTKTDTNHRTGPRDRPGRTCSQNRSPSGTAQGTRRIFPARKICQEQDGGCNCLTPALPFDLELLLCFPTQILTLPPGNVRFQVRAISLVCPEPELLR